MKSFFAVTYLVCSFFANCALAKPPGYRGSRLLVQYQPSFNLNANGIVLKKDKSILSYGAYLPLLSHGIYTEYVLGRRTSLGFKARVTNNYLNFDDALNSSYYTRLVKLNDKKIELLLKVFKDRDGNLAPFGTYTQFGLGQHFFTVNHVDLNQRLYSNNNGASLSIALGYQKVYGNVIVVDVNMNFTVAFPYTIPHINTIPNGNYYRYPNHIVTQTHLNLFYQNVMGVNIGIGFLVPKR